MNIVSSSALVALLFAVSAPAIAQPAASRPANVCLNVRDIQRTEAVDDQTILFHMRGGKIWRNTLKAACPMLKVSPFTEVLNSGELVCANQQFIRLALTGNQCVLGDFTPVAPAR
jgi:hypothetical protein